MFSIKEKENPEASNQGEGNGKLKCYFDPLYGILPSSRTQVRGFYYKED